MIAYRAEIWCNHHGCSEGYAKGTAHDDPTQLPGLARNLIEIREHEGWRTVGQRHFCPQHKKPAGPSKARTTAKQE